MGLEDQVAQLTIVIVCVCVHVCFCVCVSCVSCVSCVYEMVLETISPTGQ